jgi:UrcA family protein
MSDISSADSPGPFVDFNAIRRESARRPVENYVPANAGRLMGLPSLGEADSMRWNMFSRKTKSGLLALTAVTILSGGTAALARDETVVVRGIAPEDQIRRTVSYRDLNLATGVGERTLNQRVDSAVKDICSEAVGWSATARVEMNCERAGWNGARPQVAQAVERAKQLAATGKSSIAAVAITISINP